MWQFYGIFTWMPQIVIPHVVKRDGRRNLKPTHWLMQPERQNETDDHQQHFPITASHETHVTVGKWVMERTYDFREIHLYIFRGHE